MSVCPRCPELVKNRTQVVAGDGPPDARLVLVGEAPGWHEDQQGLPFVGPAGQLLDQLLRSVGLSRSQVYITNVIKCRPPQNRDPLPQEVENCRPWLEAQLARLKPRVIIPLGRHALVWFFPQESIARLHGTTRRREGVVYYFLYHPAAALHQPSLKRTLEEDFKRVPALLAEAAPAAPDKPQPEQLSLF
ncbi:MAG: uracil-DNA glycosylase [Chloroflexi bacterium]|nr:uracil-DNA glycosylase [Chloroflexota bacterium]